ncbi:MAG: TonB-dependent receptor, partial [Pseudomonadota bacterium]
GDSARLRQNETRTFSQELRLHFDRGRVKGLLGAYYFDRTIDDDSQFDSQVAASDFIGPALIPFYRDPFPLRRVTDFDVDITNIAFFGETEVKTFDWLRFIAGLRYDYEKQKFRNFQKLSLRAELADPATIPFPLNVIAGFFNQSIQPALEPTRATSSASYSAWLPKLGVIIDWTDNFSTGFTVQRGYRAGGADLVPGPQNEYDPEFTTNLELSIRSSWFENRLTANANIFIVDWKDQQVLVPQETVPVVFFTENAGRSRLEGFEVELRALVWDGLEIYGGLGHVRTEFREFVTTGADFSGNDFTNAPKWTFGGGFVKRWPNGLFLGGDVSTQTKTWDDPANTLRLDDRTVYNARVGYESEFFSVLLQVRNLFDEDYITRRSVRTNAVKVGEPRSIGLEVRVIY